MSNTEVNKLKKNQWYKITRTNGSIDLFKFVTFSLNDNGVTYMKFKAYSNSAFFHYMRITEVLAVEALAN